MASVPQHGDQAYSEIVKVRIWISRLYFSFSSRRCHSLLDMRVTAVRGTRSVFSLRRRIRAAVSGLGVGVRQSGTLEGGTQLGGFRSKPLELGGVESNPIPSHHLAGDLHNSLLHGPTPTRHIIADRFGGRRGISHTTLSGLFPPDVVRTRGLHQSLFGIRG